MVIRLDKAFCAKNGDTDSEETYTVQDRFLFLPYKPIKLIDKTGMQKYNLTHGKHIIPIRKI